MKVGELMAQLEAIDNDEALVMGIDLVTGTLLNIENVKSETHEDADGSTTVWIGTAEH